MTSSTQAAGLFSAEAITRARHLGPKAPAAIVPVISERLHEVGTSAQRLHDYLARRAYQSDGIRGLVVMERREAIAARFGVTPGHVASRMTELRKAGLLRDVSPANRRDALVIWLPLVASGTAILSAAHAYAKGA